MTNTATHLNEAPAVCSCGWRTTRPVADRYAAARFMQRHIETQARTEHDAPRLPG